MAYRIRPFKTFTDEFRRVAAGQLHKAIAELSDQPDGPHAAIHAARKRFKRLRSLYRLIQPDARDVYHRENVRIRDMGRTLSAVRDATALVETVDDLMGYATSDEERAALSFALNALSERRDGIAAAELDLPGKIDAAIATCHAALEALDELDLADGRSRTAKRLAKAWGKRQAKARHALARCRTTHAGGDFHELRKSGQTTWMHLSLLRDLWPTAMAAKQREVKRLVDMLGYEHDLTVLTQTVNENPELFGDSDTLARLIAAIILRQQAIRGEALELAELVFADDPEREADIIAMLWIETADRNR
ncbi:CHAD domain-containing protein [Rhizobium sp. SAFR-030]|uniref:CHAD domain-containing protein n=1 Tax=Rhizobium sp. SAFR-030 TaxID=3387277 RepID=UPI003F7EF696